MSYHPRFHFFIPGRTEEADTISGLFEAKLPRNRKNEENPEKGGITCGDYFFAVKEFLSAHDFRLLRKALPKQITPDQVRDIHIFLEKHGEFYHPARVEVPIGSQRLVFVVNVAVYEAGCRCIEQEYAILEKLGEAHAFLPRVFGMERIDLPGGETARMFLAEWFEGYSEFHISRDEGRKKVVVWDREKGNFYLEPPLVFDLYRQASKIMTCFYNPRTFEQIQPWHHAAGDFVVKIHKDSVDVRLITARQYTSLFETVEEDDSFILEALLVFFLNLSIRMRLDRVDGVKETVWADETVVAAFLTGFLEGLGTKGEMLVSGIPLDELFPAYLKNLDGEDLLEYVAMILSSWNPASEEIAVVKKNINDHVRSLLLNIDKYC